MSSRQGLDSLSHYHTFIHQYSGVKNSCSIYMCYIIDLGSRTTFIFQKLLISLNNTLSLPLLLQTPGQLPLLIFFACFKDVGPFPPCPWQIWRDLS